MKALFILHPSSFRLHPSALFIYGTKQPLATNLSVPRCGGVDFLHAVAGEFSRDRLAEPYGSPVSADPQPVRTGGRVRRILHVLVPRAGRVPDPVLRGRVS